MFQSIKRIKNSIAGITFRYTILNDSQFAKMIMRYRKYKINTIYQVKGTLISCNMLQKHKNSVETLSDLTKFSLDREYYAYKRFIDSFLVLTYTDSEQDAFAFGKALLDHLKPFCSANARISGVSLKRSETPDSLFEKIDQVDYHLQNVSENIDFHSELISEEFKKEKETIQAFNKALLKNQPKILSTYFQPIYSKSGRISAVEALSRMQTSKYGDIKPDYFIPLLEKNGFMKSLTLKVLKDIFHLYNALPYHERNTINYNINMTAQILMDENFIEDIMSEMKKYGFPEHLLTFEITEQDFLKNNDKLLKNIAKVRSKNIKLALDDLGKGYSSLLRLKSNIFDYVKIDKDFLEQKDEAQKNIFYNHIVGIIALFDAKTVIEGVETKTNNTFANTMDIAYRQGFYYCEPLSENALIKKINH